MIGRKKAANSKFWKKAGLWLVVSLSSRYICYCYCSVKRVTRSHVWMLKRCHLLAFFNEFEVKKSGNYFLSKVVSAFINQSESSITPKFWICRFFSSNHILPSLCLIRARACALRAHAHDGIVSRPKLAELAVVLRCSGRGFGTCSTVTLGYQLPWPASS